MGADNHLTVDVSEDNTNGMVVYEVKDWRASWNPVTVGLYQSREKAEAVAAGLEEYSIRERVVE